MPHLVLSRAQLRSLALSRALRGRKLLLKASVAPSIPRAFVQVGRSAIAPAMCSSKWLSSCRSCGQVGKEALSADSMTMKHCQRSEVGVACSCSSMRRSASGECLSRASPSMLLETPQAPDSAGILCHFRICRTFNPLKQREKQLPACSAVRRWRSASSRTCGRIAPAVLVSREQNPPKPPETASKPPNP